MTRDTKQGKCYCHSPIGLSGLNSQRQHFECFIHGKEKAQPSKEIKECLQYGTDNEINGVATNVSKVLSIYIINECEFC